MSHITKPSFALVALALLGASCASTPGVESRDAAELRADLRSIRCAVSGEDEGRRLQCDDGTDVPVPADRYGACQIESSEGRVTLSCPGRPTLATGGRCEQLVGDLEVRDRFALQMLHKAGCRVIFGDLRLAGEELAGVTDLRALEGLRAVEGTLAVGEMPDLVSMRGLERLTAVGGDLQIGDLPALERIGGLTSLHHVGGALWIAENPALVSPGGLEALESIGGGLHFVGLPSLQELAGLDSLHSVGGPLSLVELDALESLEGLGGLLFVDGALVVSGNDVLTSLKGVPRLRSCGSLTIEENDALTSLAAIGPFETLRGPVSIAHNDALAELVELVAPKTILGELDIVDNDALVSLSGLEGVSGIMRSLRVEGNARLVELTPLAPHVISGRISITLRDNAKLESFEMLSNGVMVRHLTIEKNPSLETFSLGDNARTSEPLDLRVVDNANLSSTTRNELRRQVQNNHSIDARLWGNSVALDDACTFSETRMTSTLECAGTLIRLARKVNRRYRSSDRESCEVVASEDEPNRLVCGEGAAIPLAGECETFPGDLSIDHRIEMAAFARLGCTQIAGDLDLQAWGQESVTLEDFSYLTAVSGSLTIRRFYELASLRGLEGLERVGGDMTLSLPETIDSLEALRSLRSVGGSLNIGGNYIDHGQTFVHDLDGLEGLESIGDDLAIRGGEKLESVEGLRRALEGFDGSILIMNNPVLESLSGFESVSKLESALIQRNPSLTSLRGLDALEEVDKGFLLQQNQGLESLHGLENMRSVSFFEVSYHHRLRSLRGLEGLRELDGELMISGNKSLVSLEGIEGLRSCRWFNIVHNPSLERLTYLPHLETLEGRLHVVDNPSLSTLEGLEKLASARAVDLEGNHALRSLRGLGGLRSVEDDVHVIRNDGLTSLEGLGALRALGDSLEIVENPSLRSLAGLGELETVENIVQIGRNDILTDLGTVPRIDSFGAMLVYANQSLEKPGDEMAALAAGRPDDVYLLANGPLASDEKVCVAERRSPIECRPRETGTSSGKTGGQDTSNDTKRAPASGAATKRTSDCAIFFGDVNNERALRFVEENGCEMVAGNISTRNASELERLSRLRIVLGRLRVTERASSEKKVEDLAALSKLQFVSGGVSLEGLDAVESLAGLSGLRYVGGHLVAERMDALTTLGLDRTAYLSGLTIRGNPRLEVLDGPGAIPSTGSIEIEGNESLRAIEGFGKLRHLSGDLELEDNPKLVTLGPLAKLERIEGDLELSGLDALIEVDGFAKIEELEELEIVRNARLIKIAGFEKLARVREDVIIEDNPKLAHIDAFPKLARVRENVVLDDNPRLARLEAFSKLARVDGRLSIVASPSLTTLSAFGALRRVGSLRLYGLPRPTTLTGLERLVSIEENATLMALPALTTLDGLSSLRHVGGRLSIVDLPKLTDTDGLRSLERVGALELLALPKVPRPRLDAVAREIDASTVLRDSAAGKRRSCRLDADAEVPTVQCDDGSRATLEEDSGCAARPLDRGVEIQCTGGPAIPIDGREELSADVHPTHDLELFALAAASPGRIEGSVRIEGIESPHLRFLQGIDTISGALRIEGTDELLTLGGLETRTIGGELALELLPSLRDAGALTKLRQLGSLRIMRTGRLRHFPALDHVERCGEIHFQYNYRLERISGFPKLVEVGGKLSFEDNRVLRSIEGLGALRQIGGNFVVEDHPRLTTMGPCARSRRSKGSSNFARIPRWRFSRRWGRCGEWAETSR